MGKNPLHTSDPNEAQITSQFPSSPNSTPHSNNLVQQVLFLKRAGNPKTLAAFSTPWQTILTSSHSATMPAAGYADSDIFSSERSNELYDSNNSSPPDLMPDFAEPDR